MMVAGISILHYTKSLGCAVQTCKSMNEPLKWKIVMGDNERFWVVTRREAGALKKLGYETFEVWEA